MSDFIDNWCDALEDGEFEQCANYLYKDGAYCVMGVAMKIGGLEPDSIALFPPPSFLEENRLQNTEDLADMNDNGKSFPEIAAHIRDNKELYMRKEGSPNE